MPVRDSFAVAIVLLAVSMGCTKEESMGPPRLETTPIQGRVLVDGQPAERLKVKFTPGEDQQIAYELVGYTDAEGVFRVGTYEAGDGVPTGSYTLTFEWIQGTGMVDRRDVLGGKYTDIAASEWSVDVAEGVPADVGTIELTTDE